MCLSLSRLARRNQEYDKADAIRSALQKKGIKVDDSTSRWWLQAGVPTSVSAAKGTGHWASKEAKDWVCVEGAELVNAELVAALLARRGAARAAKDFAAADAVYAELKNLRIVVNDNTKTWRVWSETSGLRPMDNPLE